MSTQLLDNKINKQVERNNEPNVELQNNFMEKIPSGRITEHPSVKTQFNANLDNRMVSQSVSIEQDELLKGKPFQSFAARELPKEPQGNGNIGMNTGFRYQRGNYQFNPHPRDEVLLDDVGMKMKLASQVDVSQPVRSFKQFTKQ